MGKDRGKDNFKGKGKGKDHFKGRDKGSSKGKGKGFSEPTITPHETGNDEAERARLKVCVSGLPHGVPKQAVEDYFERYGKIESTWLSPPTVPDQHAFIVFSGAAETDCAAVDTHNNFPHARGPLSVTVVGSKPLNEAELKEGDSNPYKIFAAPIPDDIIGNNEAIGDFFSKWGLVAMVQKGAKGFCFILYVSRDGAYRILKASRDQAVYFHGKHLDIKCAQMKKQDDFTPMAQNWPLRDRAIKRHFHKVKHARKNEAKAEARAEAKAEAKAAVENQSEEEVIPKIEEQAAPSPST